MATYRLAGQEFIFSCPVSELKPFEMKSLAQRTAEEAVPFITHPDRANRSDHPSPVPAVGNRQTVGWVGGAQRLVEVSDTSHGFVMEVDGGGGEFQISPAGDMIGKMDLSHEYTLLDRQIICGPALVLALALRGIWSLHASAALYKGTLIVFLGESGQGKSTLVGFLSQSPGWRLVADDILPATSDPSGVYAWSHFPQLKLSSASQPGPHLPESLLLNKIFLLLPAGKEVTPAVQLFSPGEAVKTLLAHTAGTRLFNQGLLAQHLEFCSQVASQVPVYQLIYPHGMQMLPEVKQLLETHVNS
jgi:hypothetical protein